MGIRGQELYDFKQRLSSALSNLRADRDVSRKNKQDIERFHQHCICEGLSMPRAVKYVVTLNTLARMLGRDLEAATREDIERLVVAIETSEKGYSEWTKKDFKVCLKKFYRWLRGTEKGFPPEVAWLSTSVRYDRRRMPDELLTEEDITQLVKAAPTPRDKALLFTLYESGTRIGELASVRIKHWTCDDHGSIMVVDGKTGMRRIRLIAADPYLRAWLNEHPRCDDPEAPLWVKSNGDAISYSTIAGMIRRVVKKSGIRKHVHAHLFRHSRATFLSKHLTEAQMAHFFGWVQGTKMAAVYVHLGGRDLDDALFGLYGIKEKEQDAVSRRPIKCPRCSEQNRHGTRFCGRCGLVLDMEAAMEVEERTQQKVQEKSKMSADVFSRLLDDPEVEELMRRKMEALKLSNEMQGTD